MSQIAVFTALTCLIAVIGSASCLPTNSRETYEGHRVYDIRTDNATHKDILSALIDEHELDVWRYPKSYGDTMSVRVRPEYIRNLLDSLKKHGLHYRIKIRNVQSLIDEESHSISQRRKKRATDFDLYNYNSHSKINEFMTSLASTCSACSLESMGSSHENRNMLVLKISNGGSKPAIFIDGGIHAREWISPATVINIMYSIATDSSLSGLIDSFDWYFLPVANPDGYQYSIDSSRMWRKTRSLYSGCYGADPNRNFGYEWGGSGASAYPCSDTYRGRFAFSEIEASNMRDYISSKSNIKSYITFHSYGQYFLYPWGYQGCVANSPVDDSELRSLATVASDAIRNANGGLKSRYTVGPSGCVLYAAAGGSDDWAKGDAGIKYSYTVELPDTGRHGFILPVTEIQSVSVETIAGIKAFAETLIQRL